MTSVPSPPDMLRAFVTWTSGHAGENPALTGARGYVLFEATAKALTYSDVTVLPTPVQKRFVSGLMDAAHLIVNDPEIWNWRVTPKIGGIDWAPFHIDVPVDGLDLASAVIVPGKGPVRAVTGRPGAKGAQGASLKSLAQIDLETLQAVIEDPLTGETSVEVFTLTPGPEGPYGGTSVVDPQVASLIAPGMATGLAVAESTSPQADYVATLSALAAYDRMTVTKVDQYGQLDVKCSSPSGGYVTYRVTNDLNYQYVAEVRSLDPSSDEGGEETTASFSALELTLENFVWKYPETTPYVEQVGAEWTAVVTTTLRDALIRFRSLTDSRGGVWRISIDGTALQADVSTWAATTQVGHHDALTIPDPGTYTIRGRFMGDDPENPPTALARGWTQGVNTADPGMVKVIERAGVEISPRSNKDFAIRLKPLDAAESEFVPKHGTESEEFASPTRYYSAGAPLDVASMATGETIELDSFEWVQHIYGRNSHTGSRNIAEVWTTQRITPDGIFRVAGRWKTLESLEVGRVYHLMMMGSTPLFDEAVSSLSGSYALDGPETGNMVTDEGNLADSWALLSSTSSAVAAVRYDHRRESLRTGQVDAPPRGDQTFIELRASGVQAKVYPPIYDVGATIPAGRVHRFSGSYFYGSVPGARDSLSLQ